MLLRLGRRIDIVRWHGNPLEERAAGGADKRRSDLTQDALHGSRVLLGPLVDPHGHRWEPILQTTRCLGRQRAEVVEGKLVEAVSQRRPARASVDQERGAADRDHAQDDSRDTAESHCVGGGPSLEPRQVVVHPLPGGLYLPFDFTRRSAHSLFSFKLSMVLGGSLICRRALPMTIRTSPTIR